MSSQKDNTVMDSSIDRSISPYNTGIVLDSLYNSLVLFCKREDIPLSLDKDDFVVGYSFKYSEPSINTISEYFEHTLNLVQCHKDSDAPSQLGLVLPVSPGNPMANPAMSPQTSGSGSSDFIKILQQEYSDLAKSTMSKVGKATADAVSAKTQEMLGTIAGGILNNAGGTQGPAQGGGGRGETFGGVGNVGSINENFSNYEHPTVKLDYSLGILGTTKGTSPFDQQYNDPNNSNIVLESPLTLKVVEFILPNDEDYFNTYFSQEWVPYIREALQGEKRLNTNLSLLLTPTRMKTYIQKVATAMQIYHFFVNVFNYCRLSEGMDMNAGLRYMREQMFTTTNLQKLSLLRSRLDSLPWPQTLDSEIAYQGMIYTQSDCPFSGMRMNVPDIFVSSTPTFSSSTENTYSVITSLHGDLIQGQLDSLDYQNDPAAERIDALKMIGSICNTTEFQKSRVGSFQFEPFTDPIYNNQFANSGVTMDQTPSPTSANFAPLTVNFPVKGEHIYTPVNYYSYTNDVPGMLQATWTPAKTSAATDWLGFWKPRAGTTVFKRKPNQEVSTKSNIMFFIANKGTDTLVDQTGAVADRGGFMHANIDIQSCWAANDFVENPVWTSVLGAVDATTVQKKPFGSQRIINMSLELNNYQRIQYFRQIMETSGWAIGRGSISSSSTPSRSKGRYSSKKKDSESEGDT